MAVYIGFDVAGTIVVISYTSPIFIAVFVPLSLLYWFVQNVYVATSRQLKRLESSTRSPIYSWFGEALNGVATIRAYGLQAKLRAVFIVD
jgi:ABC-type multidrug transport system fused ATPase/permease subunit